MVFIYAAELDPKNLDEENQKWIGDLPNNRTTFFPLASQLCGAVESLVKHKGFKGYVTKFNDLIIKINKEQLLEFVQKCYNSWENNPPMLHLLNDYHELESEITGLKDNETYALVMYEDD